MDEHYYSESPSSAHETTRFALSIAGHSLTFETDAGVFSKGHLDKGTSLLINALPDGFSGRALDLGCGWGPVGVSMAARWPDAQVVMTDINARATLLSQRNLALNSLHAQVMQGDGLAHLSGMFDMIVTNPPIRAGKSTVYRLFDESRSRLLPEGSLYIVMRKQQGADSAKKYLSTQFPAVEVLARSGGFHVIRAVMPPL